jgi:hypothetical protein
MSYSLNLFAAGPKVSQDDLDTLLVDDAHTLRGYPQRDKTLLRFHPKTVLVQIGQKTPFGTIFCVGNIVSRYWTLAGNLTYSGHGLSLPLI